MALITPDKSAVEAAWRDGRPLPADATILGLCTCEDIIEEIIGEEVLDEMDQARTVGEVEMRQTSGRDSYRHIVVGDGTLADPLLPSAAGNAV